MFNCKEVTRLISDTMDREIPFHRRMGIRIHLLMCRFCARYLKQLRTIRELMHLQMINIENSQSLDDLPPQARDRIRNVIQDKLQK